MKLPTGWHPVWPGDEELSSSPPGPPLSLREADHPEQESLSLAFLHGGWGAWGLPGPPEQARIELDRFPALDEVWCLFMWARDAAGDTDRSAWGAIAQYVADVRQGFWPDQVPPEQAVQSIYQAMVHKHLVEPATPRRARFLDEALALAEHVAARVAAGDSLLQTPHFTDAPAYQRHVAMLRADRDLYREDVARGRRYSARLPARCSAAGVVREASLLSLVKPTAQQFKLWARSDPEAPGGAGYPLLLVEIHDEEPVLSADPVKRIKVGWLAAALTERERALGQQAREDDTWYDGARHEGTLLAAPRGGTRLPREDILALLTEELGLEPLHDETLGATAASPPPEPAKKARPWGVALAALAALAGGWWALGRPGVGADPAPAVVAQLASATPPAPAAVAEHGDDLAGAKGEPLTADKVEEVVAAHANGGRAQYALLAGVCSYEGSRRLRAPCRDAGALRKLLIERYGYRPEHITYLVDEPGPGEEADGAPTAENMKRHIERFRERFGDNEDSSFLFYYSGHGGYVDGAHDDYGVLQPTGFFDKFAGRPTDHRGWDMQQLVRDIKKGVPSRHIMAIIDACYSGWTGAKGDDELDDKVRSLWRSRAEVILSAASKGQQAWEDEVEGRTQAWQGHSALTAFLLRGLSVDGEGHAHADRNGDGIVTDEELGRYVKKEVPGAVAMHKSNAKQTPQFFRLDKGQLQSGQFLFVPHRTAE